LTLSAFGAELEAFGPHLNEYAKSISAVTADTGTKTETIASAITALNDGLPVSGGIVQWFTGEQNLATFGENLEAFGNSMNTYYHTVKDIETNTLSHVMDQFRRLINAAEDIQGIDNTGLATFASNIVLIATQSIDEFIDAFDDAEEEVVQAGADFVDNFRKGALDEQTTLNSTWSSLSDAIITLLETMETDYYDEGGNFVSQIISGANSQEISLRWGFATLINSCLSEMEGLYTGFEHTGQTFIVYFSDGIEAKTSYAEASCIDLVDDCRNAIKAQYPNFKTIGWNVMAYFVNGITEQKDTVKTKTGNNVAAAINVTKDYYDDFYDVGIYLVRGFANGITAETYEAQAAASAMAAAAALAAQDELEIASPSKVGYGIGGYFGLGFVNAITDYADTAYDVSADMADSARTGLSKAISKVIDVIDRDADIMPVVRPVLDLSNVEAGVSEMNAMLSETQALSISAALMDSYDVRNQNALDVNNDDVVEAIEDLRGDLASLSSVVGNLRVVMDTGALVGQIATPMNYALGKQATYTGRGI
ncbi:MAG: hypothetical protein LUE29_09865, partial [Lachnospiraceae bacterium]|nr:hypothetical protein [Lachnospiraceae bacterium]